MYLQVIQLTTYQLIKVGVYLGHDKKHSKFLSSGTFEGGRQRTFIISMMKTIYMFKVALRSVLHVAKNRRPVGYVSMNPHFGSMIARYGYIAGEVFNVYGGIGGSLTNFRSIIGGHELLLRLLREDKYKMRHIDRKKLAGFVGLLTHRRRMPGIGFIPNVLESNVAVDEFITNKVPNIGIVDSNVGSGNLLIPIAGNDDSIYCINFYCYMLTRAVLSGKLRVIDKGDNNIMQAKKFSQTTKRLVTLYLMKHGDFAKQSLLLDFIDFATRGHDDLTYISIREKILMNTLATDLFSTGAKSNDNIYPLTTLELDLEAMSIK